MAGGSSGARNRGVAAVALVAVGTVAPQSPPEGSIWARSRPSAVWASRSITFSELAAAHCFWGQDTPRLLRHDCMPQVP